MIEDIDRRALHNKRKTVESFDGSTITRDISAIYIKPIYLLGMRSLEATDFELLTIDPRLDESRRNEAYRDVEKAEKGRIFRNLTDIKGDGLAWKAITDPTKMDSTTTPLVAKIYSRKKEHLMGEHVQHVRYAILKDISNPDMEALFWCSRLRPKLFPGLSGSDVRDTDVGRTASQRVTKKIRRRLPEVMDILGIEQFDLTTLRHEFANRCREDLDHAEAAALLGHSGPRTTRGYGKRYKRWKKKTGRGDGTGWMPTADPETVSVLEKYFYPDDKIDLSSDGGVPQMDNTPKP